MVQVETITRKWGNSLGVTIPNEIIRQQHIHENQRIIIEITFVKDIKSLRGLVKFKKNTQSLKDEMKKGWE